MRRKVDQEAFGARLAARRNKLDLSREQLGAATGYKQQSIVSMEAGVVARPGELSEIATALRTTESWLLWAEGPEDADEAPSGLPANVREVPLISWVSAGQLFDSATQIDDTEAPKVLFADLPRGAFIALKVQNDSMDRISPEGSTIVVDITDRRLVNGRAYVFSIRGETTYKIWRPDPPRLEPFSINAHHSPIFVKGKREMGVVGRVRRSVLDL